MNIPTAELTNYLTAKVDKQIVAIVDAKIVDANQYQAGTPNTFATSSGVGMIVVGNVTREGTHA